MNPGATIHPGSARRAGFFILTCLCFFLVQCAGMFTDPGFEQMKASAYKNPRRDAIVGMWHRKSDDAFSSQRNSWLFRENGTGVARTSIKGLVTIDGDLAQSAFTWRYEGGGLWKTQATSIDQTRSDCWLSGSHLLMTTYTLIGPINFVAVRVE